MSGRELLVVDINVNDRRAEARVVLAAQRSTLDAFERVAAEELARSRAWLKELEDWADGGPVPRAASLMRESLDRDGCLDEAHDDEFPAGEALLELMQWAAGTSEWMTLEDRLGTLESSIDELPTSYAARTKIRAAAIAAAEESAGGAVALEAMVAASRYVADRWGVSNDNAEKERCGA